MSSKKKLVIKPFRPNAQWDEHKARNVWQALSNAIKEIHKERAGSLSFEELYRNAYNLVLQKHGDLLYRGVSDQVKNHLRVVGEKVAQATDDDLLQQLNEAWERHTTTMVMIRDILMYMDRTYVVQQKKDDVYNLGLKIFLSEIARHPQVKERLLNLLLRDIQQERDGELIDHSLIKNVLQMFVALGVSFNNHTRDVYQQDFEKHFLKATAQFYMNESTQYVAKNTCPVYLVKAEKRLKEEQERIARYLDASTEPKLINIVQRELICKRAEMLVKMENSGCVAMFKDEKLEDLRRMYSLFKGVDARQSSVNTLKHLQDALDSYAYKSGQNLIKDEEKTKDPVGFVDEILKMREKFEKIVIYSFEKDKVFERTLKTAFERFINEDSRCARYLSLYVDHLLKKKLKGMTEDAVDEQLDKVIVIFRYLSDKDIFENFYKQHLSKRMLSGRSISEDAERGMISKLKKECGYQFTQRMEGMFKDVHISKDILDQFRKSKYCKHNVNAGKSKTGAGSSKSHNVELEVKVLTSGFWPTPPVPQCNFPAKISELAERFKLFYLENHSGRKLAWQCNMGTVDVRAIGFKRKHELNVSTYQMCILNLYNIKNEYTFQDILDETQIPRDDLKRHIISMSLPKFQILRKKPKDKGIKDTDVFAINFDFKSKLYRVRVPLVIISSKSSGGSGNSSNKELHQISKAVEQDRRHAIEASIVRIMKTRKSLDHNTLVAEVTRQLSSKFVPSPQHIKKRIESLIEREYLERQREDRKVYNYLA
jgi:cullin 3